MPNNALDDVLREVRLVREKVERLEELVEERIVGLEEPSRDEAESTKQYMKAKRKRKAKLIPLENIKKRK